MTTGDNTSSGFGFVEVELEIPIAAPALRVWHAITGETSRWWRKDFYTLENPIGFVIEPRVGGRMYEYGGGGAETLWASVVAIDPGKTIDFVGHLTPAFGGPAISMLHLEMREDGDESILRITDNLIGRVTPDLQMEMQQGWRVLFEEGLKPYVESTVKVV